MVTTQATEVAVSAAVTAATGASTGGGLTLLSFTPATAALGGLLLGLAAAGKLLTTGRVLGISGAVKGLVAGDPARWRFAFLLGLAIGALSLGGLVPGAIEAIPASFPVWRAVLAGLLVGLGSSLGNGCTSGHGICGSARLSPRSFAYTGTFMASGMATASLAGTAAALNVAPLAPALAMMPTAAELRMAAGVAAAGVAAFAALVAAQRLPTLLLSRQSSAGALQQQQQQDGQPTSAPAASEEREKATAAAATQQQQQPLELGAELIAGVVFALGLGLSGMTRPSKVAGFLSVSAPSWDLSLPFVMGGAVAVAIVAYQGVMRYRLLPKPLFCQRFQLPTSSLIDARLLGGGVLFGAGWGLAGMCPGPALVAALYGDPHVLSFVAAMAAGMWLEGKLSAALEGTGVGVAAPEKRRLAQLAKTLASQ